MKNVPATTGTNYYGLIADFDSFDVIQLAGSVNKYILAASSSDLPQGTRIFLNDGATPKLIGIVANISPSDLSLTNSNQFTFV